MQNNYLTLTATQPFDDFNHDLIPHDSYWDSGEVQELKIHRIHAYPAKFPSFITTKAIAYTQKESNQNLNRLADIFCGCGTSAYEAKRNGIAFWGCDINPVATLIAKTKSNQYNQQWIDKYHLQILKHLESASCELRVSKDANDRIDYWFSLAQKKELSKILNAINEVVPGKSKYHDFFCCAFSNILKGCSKWLQKSIKPQIDPNKEPVKPMMAFSKQVEIMKMACIEAGSLDNSEVSIANTNFLDVHTESVEKVDLIVTSPPYVTSYEYADLHQLSSLWLGYTDDYRKLRNGSIGSTQHDFNFSRESKRLNSTASKIVFNLYTKDKSTAKSVAKYYLDMQKVAEKCAGLLTDDGNAFFVIGNTKYKDVYIDNAKHLTESLLASGFASVSIAKRKISNKILTPYRDNNGRFTNDKSGQKVYSDEYVLIAKK